MKSTEKNTQRAVIEYLSVKSIFHWRQNQGAFKTDRGGFYRLSSMSGMPDIFVLKNGIIYGLEIKDIKGKQNDNQKDFEKKFVANGGIYRIIKNVDEVRF